MHERIENILKYKGGMISENQTIQMSTMQSPFFPNFYPRDIIIEHLIECNSNGTTECHIEIVFLDFLIGSTSVMEVIFIQNVHQMSQFLVEKKTFIC